MSLVEVQLNHLLAVFSMENAHVNVSTTVCDRLAQEQPIEDPDILEINRIIKIESLITTMSDLNIHTNLLDKLQFNTNTITEANAPEGIIGGSRTILRIMVIIITSIKLTMATTKDILSTIEMDILNIDMTHIANQEDTQETVEEAVV